MRITTAQLRSIIQGAVLEGPQVPGPSSGHEVATRQGLADELQRDLARAFDRVVFKALHRHRLRPSGGNLQVTDDGDSLQLAASIGLEDDAR